MAKLEHGILWLNLDDNTWAIGKRALSKHGYFLRVVDSIAAKQDHSEPVFIFTWDEGLIGIGLATWGIRQGLRQRQIRISNFHEVDIAYDALEVLWDVSADFTPPFFRTEPDRVKGARADTFLAQLAELDPRVSEGVEAITGLVVAVEQSITRSSVDEIGAFERDAIASALEVWGGAAVRKKVLLTASGRPTDEAAPFLSQLPNARLREDAAIVQDLHVFPGMEAFRRYVVGAVEFEGHGEKLTVVNCNRTRAEENLGVDLIYYSHKFASFVMVQYKSLRLERERKYVYRPQSDGSIGKEIHAMEAVRRRAGIEKDDTLDGFRLYSDPFFFKLCKSEAVNPLSTKMSHGIYVPLAIWRATCDHAKGPRGAIALTWENCPRKLSREEFIRGVRNGWFGSNRTASMVISDLLKQSLEGNRLAIFAATSAIDVTPEQSRDELGRFTSADDPLATN